MLVTAILLSRMDADTSYWTVTFYMVLAGLGLGPSLPLFTLAIQNAVDLRRLGQATSAAQFFRQIGGTGGAAIMGTVLGATLGTAFASMELPAVVAQGPEASVEASRIDGRRRASRPDPVGIRCAHAGYRGGGTPGGPGRRDRAHGPPGPSS